MSVSLGNQEQIQAKYHLTDEQYARLMGEVEMLSPQQQAALTEAYVLTWQVMDEVGGDFTRNLPALKAADLGSVLELAGWNAGAAYASPGAAICALITELSAEQREQNRNQYMAEADAIASTMSDQAEDIREKAETQWKWAVIGSVTTIAGGLLGSGLTAWGLFKADGLIGRLAQAANGAVFQSVNTMGQNVGNLATSYGQKETLLKDAEIKEKDALIEQRRAVMEMLRSLDQSLTELIQKSLSSAEAIQQGLNQTRNRILG